MIANNFCAILAVVALGGVHGWVATPAAFQLKPKQIQATALFSSSEGGESPKIDIAGKTVYQRVFYRLNPISQVDSFNNIVVEERVRFTADEAKGEGYLKPIGPRTIILRDGKVEDGEIGDEILELDVKESMAEDATHNGAGRSLAMEATIATILYLASNPKYIEGDVLELGCGPGLAGLLGCIGAGALSANEDGKSEAGAPPAPAPFDDILSIPKGAPLTDELKLLTLSDDDEESLNVAAANVKKSNVSTNKVTIQKLAWRLRSLNRKAPKVYHTIIASDLAYNFPEAKELAHIVAHQLEATSKWEVIKGESKSPPTFVHVCPEAREDASYLRKFLTQGYKMNVNTGYLKMEKLVFVFQMLPESEPESKLDDLELEVQEFKETNYQTLTAMHSPNYAEGSGEYFFPMETGEYDSASTKTYLEPENDGSKWY